MIFSYIARHASAKGSRVWIIAHRKELIVQASKTLRQFGVPNGIIKAGVTPMPHFPVQVVSVQSVVGRIGKIAPPDLIVIDEGHHATSNTYRRVLEAYPEAKVIAVTATPCRLDGKGLQDVFDDLILGPSTAELIEAGFLSPVRYFAPPGKADLSGVRVKRGDYVTSDLEDAMNRQVITGDAVEHYRTICDGQPMLSFCVSVKHAEDVAGAYRQAGYRAASVDGSLSDAEREDRIEGLGSGKYQVLTSCDLIGEGLDVPICVAAQLLRPTASLVLHLQQIGRVLRVAEGKSHAIVLDHVGNLRKHHFAETEREWSLSGRKATKHKQKDEGVDVRSCLQCFAAHDPAPSCPYCGYVYPVQARKLQVVKGTLEEIQAERQAKRQEEVEARSFTDLVALAIKRGYRRPSFWAKCKLGGRHAARRRA